MKKRKQQTVTLTRFIILLILTSFAASVHAQHEDSVATKLQQLPASFYTKAEKKYSSLDQKLSKKTLKYLNKMQRQEEKWHRKLGSVDSIAGSAPSGIKSTYNKLKEELASKTGIGQNVNLNEYSAFADTLSTSLAFLEKYKDIAGKVILPAEALDKLKSRLNETAKVKEFIAQRKEQLKQTLSAYTKIPAGLQKQYARISKTAYYYNAQVKEYKEMLSDPEKMEKKAIALLSSLPVFQQFMKENSQLASLFGLPGNYGTAASLAGLQTRASVQGLIQQRIASGGPNALAQVQQNLAEAHTAINTLKDKLNAVTNNGGVDVDMPNFKPNTQKTKSFLKRLEYSADVQFEKSNNLVPSAANIGLGIGYKLNDKSTIGIGGSYKAGLGSLQHIRISHEGIGLRSFIDWKIKKQFYIAGGYELNHQSGFRNIEELQSYAGWQRSALAGLSKKYKISKKVKGEMKLLYDFLHRDHVPVSPAVVFRLGYKF